MSEEEKPGGGINARLTKFINALLDEVDGKPTSKKKAGRPKSDEETEGMMKVEYTLKDKLDVFDRALKLEALRLKVVDNDEGSGFSD